MSTSNCFPKMKITTCTALCAQLKRAVSELYCNRLCGQNPSDGCWWFTLAAAAGGQVLLRKRARHRVKPDSDFTLRAPSFRPRRPFCIRLLRWGLWREQPLPPRTSISHMNQSQSVLRRSSSPRSSKCWPHLFNYQHGKVHYHWLCCWRCLISLVRRREEKNRMNL